MTRIFTLALALAAVGAPSAFGGDVTAQFHLEKVECLAGEPSAVIYGPDQCQKLETAQVSGGCSWNLCDGTLIWEVWRNQVE